MRNGESNTSSSIFTRKEGLDGRRDSVEVISLAVPFICMRSKHCSHTVGGDIGHLNDWEECLQTWKQARIHHVVKVVTFCSVSTNNCYLSTTQCHSYIIT